MVTASLKADGSDPVTGYLRTDFARLREGQTVAEALAGLRQHPPGGRIIYFYVVDDAGRLRGVVPARRLLLADPAAPLADLMVRHVIAIPHTATVLEVCEFFILHKLLAFPVVDEERRVLGVVDVELYTEGLIEIDRPDGGGDDLFQLVGVHLTEARQGDPLGAARRRFPWLLANVAGGLLAAGLSYLYRHELAWEDATLALFVPVVLALAESVSIQSVSLALQALHGRRPSWAMLPPRVGRELLTGALLGAGCAALVGGAALAWTRRTAVVLALGGGVLGGVAAAASLGLATPYLLRLLRRDPQVAAGPIALACADMVTLLVYFNLARGLIA